MFQIIIIIYGIKLIKTKINKQMKVLKSIYRIKIKLI
jgi:hypothetical protein